MTQSRKFILVLTSLIIINLLLLFPASIMLWGAVTLINDYSESEHHRIDQIQQLNGNTYRAGIQCSTEMVNQLLANCQIVSYQILQECERFPCLKFYRQVEFNCTNQDYIQELEGDSGGYQKNGDIEDFWLGILLIFISSLICFSFCGLIIIGLTLLMTDQVKFKSMINRIRSSERRAERFSQID